MLKKIVNRLKPHLISTLFSRKLKNRFNPNQAILLCSSPRSGSTLLAQLINTIPDSTVLFEPLHLDAVPQARTAGFEWRTYRSRGDSWKSGYHFLSEVFKGNVINSWTVREFSWLDGISSQTLIIKFVRANRLLPWICSNFELPSPIYLIRHPCAVIASQLNFGWAGVKRPDEPEFLKDFPKFKEVYDNASSEVEYLALIWCFDQIIPLLTPTPRPWIMITYEELVLSPDKVVNKINSQWQVDINLEQANKQLTVASSTVSQQGISGIGGWKTQLSQEQITKILTIVDAFGLSFYGSEAEPDYRQLFDDSIHQKIKACGTS